MKNNYVAIFVTFPSKREAGSVSDSLLKKRIVACANMIGGVVSKYRWKGKLETSREVLVIFKTRGDMFKAAEKEVKRLHSYEVPEIVAVPITYGSKNYIDWIEKSVV